MPFELAELREAIAIANDILSIATGVSNILGDTNAATTAIINNVAALQASIDGLSGESAGYQADTAANLLRMTDQLGAIEAKVSTIQHIMTSTDGISTNDSDWPVLDLRPTPSNEPRWFPHSSRLIDWLDYAALATVPTLDATTRLLGHVTGPVTLALAGALAVITRVTNDPPQAVGSDHPTAPTVPFLGYLSWRALGAFTAPERVNHPDQLWIPKGFQPDAVAFEPRPGVEFDCYAVDRNTYLL